MARLKMTKGLKTRDYVSGEVRSFDVPEGVENLTQMANELIDMTNVLLGRVTPPLDAGVSTLLELADAYYARAAEMTMALQKAEREGRIVRNDPYYKFRTGELRTFMDMARRSAETGSRRLTKEQLIYQQTIRGLEGAGNGFAENAGWTED